MTRVSISEARRRLAGLVRELNEDHGSVVQITVRNEVVAELRAVGRGPQPEPGEAAQALKRRGRRRNISGHVKKHLYGRKA